MGGVCRMGKSEFKSGNLKGIRRLEDILEDEETIFKSLLKVSERFGRNMQWIALRRSRALTGPSEQSNKCRNPHKAETFQRYEHTLAFRIFLHDWDLVIAVNHSGYTCLVP